VVDVVTASPLAGGLLGAGVGVGLLVVVAGWLGLRDQPRRPARRALARRTARRVDQLTWRLGLAFGGFALAGWWTRWPAAMGACAVLGWLTPSCIGLRVRRRRQVARSEAVASWAEMLRDLLVSNAGLHEAIGKSARVAPAAIRDEVKALYVRTQRGELAPALARFADEMDDGVADTVVTALHIADQRAVSDLGQMLTAVATSTRETVAMQLRIDAARARVYRTAQLIAAIVAFFVGALVVTNPEYLEPFGSAGGQVVLALVAGVVGVAVWAMVALSRPVRAPRLLRVGTATRRTVGG
jgi:tight adherence protein B